MILTSETYNQDCIIGMQSIDSKSINAIITDPPYKYLDHKLDLDFNESQFFEQAKRVLKDNGFIILFGRGKAFYRWCVMLENLGFEFKEEIIWNKTQGSSPLLLLQRIHETIAVFTKKNGKIKKVMQPYIEQKQFDHKNILADINRLKTCFNNSEVFKDIMNYLDNGIIKTRFYKPNHGITQSNSHKNGSCIQHISPLKAMLHGTQLRSVIRINRDHYNTSHPTQKPVRLMELLIQLVCNPNDTIIDPFLGSGSTRIAAMNTSMNFIGYEIDTEYFNMQEKRYQDFVSQTRTF